ncbi:MAG: hypothetical protein ABSH44_17575 [Bryobacteraceae bacterium]|jgi:hypothetical protein
MKIPKLPKALEKLVGAGKPGCPICGGVGVRVCVCLTGAVYRPCKCTVEALLREIGESECQAAPSSQTFWDRIIERLSAQARPVRLDTPKRERRTRIARILALAVWLVVLALLATAAHEWATQ